jgi:hypothetical protein
MELLLSYIYILLKLGRNDEVVKKLTVRRKKKKKNFELYAYNIFLGAEEHQETTNLQFSIVLGRDSIRLPETLRTLSFDKHPIELGRDLS